MQQKVVLTPDEVTQVVQCLRASREAKESARLVDFLLEKMASTPVMDQLREIGQRDYQKEGEVEIDEQATVSVNDTPGETITGAYVQGWVWVDLPERTEN